MPLLESHKKYISDSLGIFFEDLPTTLLEFRAKVNDFKVLFEEGAALPLNQAQRPCKPEESSEAYDFFCVAATPQRFFHLKEIANLTVFEVLVGILDYAHAQLKNYREGIFINEVNNIWDPRESKIKISADKNTAFVPVKTEDNLLLGDQGWQIPPTPNQMFYAYITQNSQEIPGTAARLIYLTLNIVLTVHSGNQWPLTLIDYIPMTSDEEQKRRILEKSARIVETLATTAAMQMLIDRLTSESLADLSTVPSAGYPDEYVKEVGYNLLTYPYYFRLVSENGLETDTLAELGEEEIKVLRSFAVIRLQEAEILDFDDASSLPAKFLKILEEPLYLHLLLDRVLDIDDILGLNEQQISILLLPAVINMQIRNSSITLRKVKDLPLPALELLHEQVYYEKIIANKFQFKILLQINETMKIVLIEPRVVVALTRADAITAPILKLVFLLNYRRLIMSGKIDLHTIENLTEAQFDALQKHDVTLLIERDIITVSQVLELSEEKLKIISYQTYQWLLVEKKITLPQVMQASLYNAELFINTQGAVTYLATGNFIADYPQIISIIIAAHFFYVQFFEASKDPISELSTRIQLQLPIPIKDVCRTDNILLQSLLALIFKIFLVGLYKSFPEAQKPAAFAVIAYASAHDRDHDLNHFEQTWLGLFQNLFVEAERQAASSSLSCALRLFDAAPNAVTCALTNIFNFGTVVNNIMRLLSTPEPQSLQRRA